MIETRERIIRTIIEYDKLRTLGTMQQECIFNLFELNCDQLGQDYKNKVQTSLKDIENMNKNFTEIIKTMMEQVKY